jgi:hypothetical protein
MENDMTIQVKCEIREYPDEDGPYDTLIIRNHWNYTDRVVLEIQGKQYIFRSTDLRRAITNCENHK